MKKVEDRIKKDIDNLKELIRYVDPWDDLRTDLNCGEDAKELLDSAKKIIKNFQKFQNGEHTKCPTCKTKLEITCPKCDLILNE